MQIYTFHHYVGNKGKGPDTGILLGCAVRQYFQAQGWKAPSQELMTIQRNKNGKPFFPNMDLHLSVSHSEGIWACVLGSRPIGLDVQMDDGRDFLSIAKRFFLDEEYAAVRQRGSELFYRIWCRKEATVKLFGTTLGDVIERLSVAPGCQLTDQAEFNGSSVHYQDVEIQKGYYCVVASLTKEKVWINPLKTE